MMPKLNEPSILVDNSSELSKKKVIQLFQYWSWIQKSAHNMGLQTGIPLVQTMAYKTEDIQRVCCLVENRFWFLNPARNYYLEDIKGYRRRNVLGSSFISILISYFSQKINQWLYHSMSVHLTNPKVFNNKIITYVTSNFQTEDTKWPNSYKSFFSLLMGRAEGSI